MTITLTYDNVDDGLQMAVNSKGPDYVYPSDTICHYFNLETGEPACIVGNAFMQLGLAADFRQKMRTTELALNIVSVDKIIDTLYPTEDCRTRRLLMAAQVAQDYYYTWGEALGFARWWANNPDVHNDDDIGDWLDYSYDWSSEDATA